MIFCIYCVVNKSHRNLLSNFVTQLGTYILLKPADMSYKYEYNFFLTAVIFSDVYSHHQQSSVFVHDWH